VSSLLGLFHTPHILVNATRTGPGVWDQWLRGIVLFNIQARRRRRRDDNCNPPGRAPSYLRMSYFAGEPCRGQLTPDSNPSGQIRTRCFMRVATSATAPNSSNSCRDAGGFGSSSIGQLTPSLSQNHPYRTRPRAIHSKAQSEFSTDQSEERSCQLSMSTAM
jgi:hypothetical protein